MGWAKKKKMNLPGSRHLLPLLAKLDAFMIKAFPFGKEMVGNGKELVITLDNDLNTAMSSSLVICLKK